ncbi:MAG: Aromatic-ring-hydroxylating dioxygenase, beta subunit [Candidatus Carbobacillus altaicus]|uniref:Aromatic-ring-hydroxylating dioxygenase, beta subunit n=1 Tax=Candidatus Carbonibacillus altaicus TaxID=2163959 RepID=A0A2R6XZG2_9BACL|nr:MAG: Aromatic-ring-hydroxylating dioxygenase, beta subunit [Candidatus Carbobacillus altaicus]
MTQKTQANISLGDPTYLKLQGFLQEEAYLLDQGAFREWLNLLDPEVRYVMPIRTTRERVHGSGLVDQMVFFDENYASLKKRIDRLDTEYAWGEDPPSRTRRFIDNIRIKQLDERTYEVRSYFLVLRSRGNVPDYQILSGQKVDTIVVYDDGCKLKHRLIYPDQATLGVENLGIFI